MRDHTVNDNYKAPDVTSIKDVDLTPGNTFFANGKKYTVNDTFAIGRFEKVVLLEEELMMLGDRSSCHEEMMKAMELINEYKPGLAYAILYNKIESDQKSEKLIPFVLRVCTAYINYEGEDVGYLTDEQIVDKVNDWAKEGLDIRPFFVFAVHVFGKLLQSYKQPIQSILTEARKIQEGIANLNSETDTPASTG